MGVFGICQNAIHAKHTVDQLMADVFPRQRHVGLTARQPENKEVADENTTKAPEGAATGVALGGAFGIGALAMPGVGTFIAAGAILGALAGLGVGGAVGVLIGALVGMGIPEYEAKRYER